MLWSEYLLSFECFFLVWMGGLRPVGIWGHLQGENIQSYNLFSPVMMITLWMKPGGNRPPGDNPLLFSISGMGSFICPSHRHGWTYQGLWYPSHGALGGKTKCSVHVGLEPTTYRVRVERATNWGWLGSPEYLPISRIYGHVWYLS